MTVDYVYDLIAAVQMRVKIIVIGGIKVVHISVGIIAGFMISVLYYFLFHFDHHSYFIIERSKMQYGLLNLHRQIFIKAV